MKMASYGIFVNVSSVLGSELPSVTLIDVGCVVISVNYRHAPEDVYPAAVEDTVSALRWILSPENASELRIDINLLALGGLSA